MQEPLLGPPNVHQGQSDSQPDVVAAIVDDANRDFLSSHVSKTNVSERTERLYLRRHRLLIAVLLISNLAMLSLGIAMAAYGAMSDASIYSHHGKRREYSRFIWVFNGVSACGGVQIVLSLFGLYVMTGFRPNTAPESKSGLFNLGLLVYVPVLFGFGVAAFVLGIRSFMLSLGHNEPSTEPGHDHYHTEIGRDFRYNCAMAAGSLLAGAISAYASSALANLIPPSGLVVEVVSISDVPDEQLQEWGRRIDEAEGTHHAGAWDGVAALHLMKLYAAGAIPGSRGVVLRVSLAPSSEDSAAGEDMLEADAPLLGSGSGPRSRAGSTSLSSQRHRLVWDEDRAEFMPADQLSRSRTLGGAGADAAGASDVPAPTSSQEDELTVDATYRPLLSGSSQHSRESPSPHRTIGAPGGLPGSIRSLPVISAPFQPVSPTPLDRSRGRQGSSKQTTDDLVALVFITIIETYDLTGALKNCFGSLLRRLVGKDSWVQWLCIRFGLVGFQWPFHSGVFLTNVLENDKHDTTARVMRAIAQWNYSLMPEDPDRCAIIFMPSFITQAVYHMYSRGFFMTSDLTPTAIVPIKQFREQGEAEARAKAASRKAPKGKRRPGARDAASTPTGSGVGSDGTPTGSSHAAAAEQLDQAEVLRLAYDAYLTSLKKGRRKDPTVKFEQMGGRMYLLKNFSGARRLSEVRRDSQQTEQRPTAVGAPASHQTTIPNPQGGAYHEGDRDDVKVAVDRPAPGPVAGLNSLGSIRSSASGSGAMISLSSHAYRLWNQIAGARSSAGETNTLLAPTPHFFEQISDVVPPAYRTLMVLAYQGRIIASSVLFYFPTARLMTSDIHGMDHDGSREVSAYFVMMYQAVKFALAHGCDWVDFGPTTLQPKVSVGSKLVDCRSGFYADSVILRFLVMSGTRAFVKKQNKSGANKAADGAMLFSPQSTVKAGSLVAPEQLYEVVVEHAGADQKSPSARAGHYVPPPFAAASTAAPAKDGRSPADAKVVSATKPGPVGAAGGPVASASVVPAEMGRGELRRLKAEEKKRLRKAAKKQQNPAECSGTEAGVLNAVLPAGSDSKQVELGDTDRLTAHDAAAAPLSKRQQKKLIKVHQDNSSSVSTVPVNGGDNSASTALMTSFTMIRGDDVAPTGQIRFGVANHHGVATVGDDSGLSKRQQKKLQKQQRQQQGQQALPAAGVDDDAAERTNAAPLLANDQPNRDHEVVRLNYESTVSDSQNGRDLNVG